MENEKYLLKNRIGNILFISYIIMCMTIILLDIPSNGKIIFVAGAFTGFAIKVIIIIVFWQTVMTNYINEDNNLSLLQLTVGAFLLTLPLLGIMPDTRSFLKSFILISLVMILKRDYGLFIRKKGGVEG